MEELVKNVGALAPFHPCWDFPSADQQGTCFFLSFFLCGKWKTPCPNSCWTGGSHQGSFGLGLLLDEPVTKRQFGRVEVERPEIKNILNEGFCVIHDRRGLVHTTAACLFSMKVFFESALVAIRLLFHRLSFLSVVHSTLWNNYQYP